MLSSSATRLARLTRCLRHYSLAEQAIFSTHVSDAMLKFPWGKSMNTQLIFAAVAFQVQPTCRLPTQLLRGGVKQDNSAV